MLLSQKKPIFVSLRRTKRMTTKRLPIGISDFKQLIENEGYFIDKSDFIRAVIEEGSVITMFPRPRRFGKTLNLSMLRYFFEKTEGNIYRPLFEGLGIEGWSGFQKYQGNYPVVMLTLKDCKGDTYEKTLERLSVELKKEYIRHEYLLQDELNSDNRRTFECLLNRTADEIQLQEGLSLLVELLSSHYGTSVIVLLDEYDSPIHVAYDRGYYQQMIDFIRTFMSTVFKDNPNVLRGIVTGILRVSKESLFSGLNNIDVDSILDIPMSTCFGFTQTETDLLLSDYGLSNQQQAVKEWYDGYLFGNTTIYNPWSLLMFAKSAGQFAPYWVNTGSDVLLRSLIANGPTIVRKELEAFLSGGSIRCTINDKISFPDLVSSRENIWSFMLFSGYLKASDVQKTEFDTDEYTLQVPNREIALVFRSIIRSWINESPVKNERLVVMLQALLEGDVEQFEMLLNEFMVETLSFYDTGGKDVEKVYQASLLGLLVNLSGYKVTCNRESGLGRYDILLRPKDLKNPGYVMELKVYYPQMNKTVEETLASALAQIEKKQYAVALQQAGVTEIVKMAITFDGKRVWIAKQ